MASDVSLTSTWEIIEMSYILKRHRVPVSKMLSPLGPVPIITKIIVLIHESNALESTQNDWQLIFNNFNHYKEFKSDIFEENAQKTEALCYFIMYSMCLYPGFISFLKVLTRFQR